MLQSQNGTAACNGSNVTQCVASFLQLTILVQVIRSQPYTELELKLENYLFHLRRGVGEDKGPRTPAAYLEDWASDGQGWMRKCYPDNGDKPAFEIASFPLQLRREAEEIGSSLMIGNSCGHQQSVAVVPLRQPRADG